MDQMRLLLALVLSFVVFMLWNVFFGQDHKPKPIPQLQQEAQKEIKESVSSAAPAVVPRPLEQNAVPGAKQDRPARKISVETPLYTAVLSEKGGGISSFVLKKYRAMATADSPLMDLFPENGAFDGLLVGLASTGNGGFDAALFQANLAGEHLSITDGSREIVFSYIAENGFHIEKIYRFSADSYVMNFEVRFTNGSNKALKDSLFVALRNDFHGKKSRYGTIGPSLLVDRSLENVPVDEISKKNTFSGNIKWIALESQYFMTSVIPLKEQAGVVRLSVLHDKEVEAQYLEPEQSIDPGSQLKSEYILFFGPRSMDAVKQAGHNLERIIDFGTFDLLAKPCLWLLNFLYTIIPNYGVAIIILTVLTKILLWPLGTKSYKSMNQMKKLQPLLQEIREKHKNDRKKMNEEVMRLHRTYGINPLGGCLPMIVQIPVFFALYRMLDQAIELRHAPFFGWINDLSAADRLGNFSFAIPFMEPPYGIPVLTLIMGATMIWQQKMTPTAGDPTQAKMMMLMPVVFTFVFINFSSGLVLYWLINNILSIGQQYYTQKKFG
jgi:YidC/Oxa1 family membrane protein insertase